MRDSGPPRSASPRRSSAPARCSSILLVFQDKRGTPREPFPTAEGAQTPPSRLRGCRLQERLDALGPRSPVVELLHVLMLPDFERADRIGFSPVGSGYYRSLGKKGDARLAPRRWASSVGSAPCGYSNRLRPTPGSSRCAPGVTIRSSSIVIRRADHVCTLNARVRDSLQSLSRGTPRGRR